MTSAESFTGWLVMIVIWLKRVSSWSVCAEHRWIFWILIVCFRWGSHRGLRWEINRRVLSNLQNTSRSHTTLLSSVSGICTVVQKCPVWLLCHRVIVGGAYEAWRLIPPQNLGPGGMLWSVPPQKFCRQMLSDLFMAKVAVLDAFCWIKNTQKSISAGALPKNQLG